MLNAGRFLFIEGGGIKYKGYRLERKGFVHINLEICSQICIFAGEKHEE